MQQPPPPPPPPHPPWPALPQVSEALSLSPSARMAGLAADDLIVSVYFLTLYALARQVPPEGAAEAGVGDAAGS